MLSFSRTVIPILVDMQRAQDRGSGFKKTLYPRMSSSTWYIASSCGNGNTFSKRHGIFRKAWLSEALVSRVNAAWVVLFLVGQAYRC